MLVPIFLALVAAVPAVKAQDAASSTTTCETRFGYFPAPTGSSLATWYNFATTTRTFQFTSTTQETTTVTASATTFTDVVNVTSTLYTTVTSVPAATTIAAPAGFFPIMVADATPTAIGRHRRGSVHSRTEHVLHKIKRQTAPGNSAGFLVESDGTTVDLKRQFPHRVVCRVLTTFNVNTTAIVTGLPKTEVVIPATATAVSTSTFEVTETIIEQVPRPTVYAACQPNNVVSYVRGYSNEPIYFDRIIYRPQEGFPINNSIVLSMDSGVNCCIACQKQPFCAGSFFAPSRQACHLQLTQAASAPALVPAVPSNAPTPPFPLPSGNGTIPLLLPTASGAPYPVPGNASILEYLPTGTGMVTLPASSATPVPSAVDGGMSILPVSEPPLTGTPSNPGAGTCSIGSLSLYLGEAQGRSNFTAEMAVRVSNGPCGFMSIDFDALDGVMSMRKL